MCFYSLLVRKSILSGFQSFPSPVPTNSFPSWLNPCAPQWDSREVESKDEHRSHWYFSITNLWHVQSKDVSSSRTEISHSASAHSRSCCSPIFNLTPSLIYQPLNPGQEEQNQALWTRPQVPGHSFITGYRIKNSGLLIVTLLDVILYLVWFIGRSFFYAKKLISLHLLQQCLFM